MSCRAGSEPPEYAVYTLPDKAPHRWATVEARSEQRWLDQVHAAVMRAGETALVDAWLRWEAEDALSGSALAVYLGERQVGIADAERQPLRRPVMDAAIHRAELPRVHARLTKRPSPRRVPARSFNCRRPGTEGQAITGLFGSSGGVGSNHRPPGYESGALTS